jgi:phospho-N-acetylmuramoyl-pentapeptide-transferase
MGTPTSGGVVFIIPVVVISILSGGLHRSLTIVAIIILVGYALIGFFDDFIKISFKRNLGLRAYQKVIAQTALAIIAAMFCSKSRFVGSTIAIPVIHQTVDLGVMYIPFAALIFIATTNSVNLTDGVDGLAGTLSAIYFTTFLVIVLLALNSAIESGNTLYALELKSFAIFLGALIGGLAGFLWFNGYVASMMMGDTGSLSLGGIAALTALFLKNPLIILVVGLMFVVTAISVIAQVLNYKLRGKRVLLMAPLHHHLELKGYNESKIVTYYAVITALMSVLSLIII